MDPTRQAIRSILTEARQPHQFTAGYVIRHLHEHDGTGDPEFLAQLEEQIQDQGDLWELGEIPVADICQWCSDQETAEAYAEEGLDTSPAIILARGVGPGTEDYRWTTVDGAHRLTAHDIDGRETIKAFYPVESWD